MILKLRIRWSPRLTHSLGALFVDMLIGNYMAVDELEVRITLMRVYLII